MVATVDRTRIVNAYENYREIISGVLFRYLKNQQDAEDILQDTFLRVLKFDNTFRGEAEYTTWITRIAINAACQHLKAKHKYTLINFDPIEPPYNVCSAELCAIADEQLNIMQNYIQNLSDELWVVFALVQLDGRSADQVAKQLDIPPGTVKSRLSKARKCIMGLDNNKGRKKWGH